MLRDTQGCSGSEQPYTATVQGCLFIAPVVVTCAQVLGNGIRRGQDSGVDLVGSTRIQNTRNKKSGSQNACPGKEKRFFGLKLGFEQTTA